MRGISLFDQFITVVDLYLHAISTFKWMPLHQTIIQNPMEKRDVTFVHFLLIQDCILYPHINCIASSVGESSDLDQRQRPCLKAW